MSEEFQPCEGGCSCGRVRYRLNDRPFIVHGCHCTWCQRQTGTAFATNALIEAERIDLISGEVENTVVETPSGSGQRIARCPDCHVAVWSEYLVMTGGITDMVYFLRAGTLDDPTLLSPDVHIYTTTKQPWLTLPENVPAVDDFYDVEEISSPESLKRRLALREKIKERLGEN